MLRARTVLFAVLYACFRVWLFLRSSRCPIRGPFHAPHACGARRYGLRNVSIGSADVAAVAAAAGVGLSAGVRDAIARGEVADPFGSRLEVERAAWRARERVTEILLSDLDLNLARG